VQHSSPQQFRAIPLAEATETLRDQYESRVQRLENALSKTEQIDQDHEEPVQEIWSMTGRDAIANRTRQLIDDADDEIVLVVANEALLTDELITGLNDVGDEVDLLVGAVNESVQQQIHDAVPNAKTFISGLDWLRSEDDTENGVAIGRLLLVDRSSLLVSTVVPETGEEHAIFGEGFKNGLVVISRRLMAQGLVSTRDPDRHATET
jgi:sugar-specific transcriptional regulator TrmB